MDYDILIVGSGIVGTSLAVGLKNRLHMKLLKVGLIDPAFIQDTPKRQDARTIALSRMSCKILQGLSFRDFTQLAACPIQTIHVSERSRFSITRLQADDRKPLGYSIEMHSLMQGLEEALFETDCECIPGYVKQVCHEGDGWNIQLETRTDTKTIKTKLLIAADGDHSSLRKILQIPCEYKEYAQSALVTTVETTKCHEYTAFERFIEEGSIALLPIAKQKMKLVWVASKERSQALMDLESKALLQLLQLQIGDRLGKFHQLGESRHVYPLRYVKSEKQVQKGFVLMGNAAHVLHPIAAQGFNLSLRDITVFIDVIREAIEKEKDFASLETLQRYVEKRYLDQKYVALFTEGLVSFFTRDMWFASSLRSGLFNLLECTPVLKRKLVEFTVGMDALLPRWVF